MKVGMSENEALRSSPAANFPKCPFNQAEGQIAAEEDPDLLASLFINCWQGAMIRTKRVQFRFMR
jgi:Tetracyclin repressor-like, C-terminal domain